MLTSVAIGAKVNATGADSATFKILCTNCYVISRRQCKIIKIIRRMIQKINQNEYKVIGNKIVEIATDGEEKYIRKLLDSSWQGDKSFFVLAYNNKEGDNKVSVDSFKKYFLPRFKIKNYNIEIDGRNFYDQPIN